MNIFCFCSSLLGYIISVCGSDGDIRTNYLRENYEALIERTDANLLTSLFNETEMLVNLDEMLRDKNIFVIITFFGLVISPSYADSFFRTCKQSISQISDTNDEIIRHNNTVLCKKHLYLFGQRVESFSAMVLAFRKDFPYYFVQRSLKKQGFDGSDISKQSFIREIMCLLYLLYERVEQKIVEKVNRYNVLFSNTYDNTSTSMLYAELVKVYTNFLDAFILFTPASSILQCEFELPRIMAVYFSVQLLREFDLRPNNSLDAIFVKNIADYEISNGNKDIKAIEIIVIREFFNVYPSNDPKKNIHIVLPVLLPYFDAVHLVLNDYLVNFACLLLLKNIIDESNVTRLTASIFDLHRFSFYTFVKKIPNCKKTVLVLNLSGCFLGDSDLQAISEFNNLKRLVLPRDIKSNNNSVLGSIFITNARINQTLVELVYDQKVNDDELNLLKKCPQLRYTGIIPERLFNINDADILRYKNQITQLLFENAGQVNPHLNIPHEIYFSMFPCLSEIIIRSNDSEILKNLSCVSNTQVFTIRFESMNVDTSIFLQVTGHKTVTTVILEKVRFSFVNENESLLVPGDDIVLANLTMIECELNDPRLINIFGRIKVRKALEVKKCDIDMEILAVMMEGERLGELKKLELKENKMKNYQRLNMKKLEALTKIEIVSNKIYSETNVFTRRICAFPTKTYQNSTEHLLLLEKRLVIMLDLTQYVNLERLEIEITVNNHDLFAEHVSMASKLKHLTLHVLGIDIDIIKILELNQTIKFLTIYGDDKHMIMTNNMKGDVKSMCRRIKLVNVNIRKPDLFKYINKLWNIEKFDISKSVFNLKHFDDVKMFRSCRSQALLVHVAYSDDFIELLVSNDKGSLKRSRFSVQIN